MSAAPALATSLRMLGGRQAVFVFLSFAFAYFFSALLRAVTATLAPAFSAELGLSAGDLGLLAGAYFFGFAAVQLPLGSALDRFGPKRVLLAFLTLAVLGCAGFATAGGFGGLIATRMLIGVGVGACLMAPLTCYRLRFSPGAQMRANAWMLMTGSLGMLASTVPVQGLLPLVGWRGLFWAVALGLVLSMALIAKAVPPDGAARVPAPPGGQVAAAPGASPGASPGYAAVFSSPIFLRLLPLGFFLYGGLIAVQSLWAGPWLTQVAGQSPREAAQGLFLVNLSMLLAFLGWGLVTPRLVRRGWGAERLMRAGVPVSLLLLAAAVGLGPTAQAPLWAAWCVSCTFVSLAQPAIGQAFTAAQAGRALSAFNLVIFSGVFCVQWGIGLVIDALVVQGWMPVAAYRAAFALFGLCCAASYAWFLWRGETADNPREVVRP